MNTEYNNEIDRALCITISHEMVQCAEAFDRFSFFASKNINGDQKKITLIKSYNSYSNFLHHLYELYIACYERDLRNIALIASCKRDKYFVLQVKRILKNRKDAILGGYAPKCENDISVYEVEVPEKFGFYFRLVRNLRAHTDYRRVLSPEISLLEFYKKYHKFIWLLYFNVRQWWLVKEIESINWDHIVEFNMAVKSTEEHLNNST